ncbi:MAG: transcriptional regulator [Xanthomonadaceae bacterium]|jgi:predicted transcriptional regulator|nr:transcriptional regulator [Xanthomonadaceae bacterium]
MNTVIFDVLEPGMLRRDVGQAFRADAVQVPRISFASPELLFKVLGGRRWELLQAMSGAGALGIREAARRVGRDVRAVHADIQILLREGVIDRTEDGKVEFPYDAVHVDFTIGRAA